MYKDIHRVQDAIIPALLESVSLCHIKASPGDADAYKTMLDIVRKALGDCFSDLTEKQRVRLYRRLDRVVNKILLYIKREDFDTRKMFLTVTEWARALMEAGAIIVQKDSLMWELLCDIGTVIQKGYKDIANFEKIDASALKHVPKIHEIALQEGYF